MAKKILKIAGIILLILVVIVGSLVIWQWDNIKSVYIGLTESAEQIEERRNENQQGLVDDINEYMDEPVRELTAEEKEQVSNGDVSIADVYTHVFSENQGGQSSQEQTSQNTSQQGNSQQPYPAKELSEKDAIVSKYMAQLYALQSEFTAKAEATISQGDRYYESLKKTQGKATARANTISHYTPIVRGIEATCDAKVAAVIANLKKELVAIGADTDIIRTIETAYQNEKQLKLSYYANKYLT